MFLARVNIGQCSRCPRQHEVDLFLWRWSSPDHHFCAIFDDRLLRACPSRQLPNRGSLARSLALERRFVIEAHLTPIFHSPVMMSFGERRSLLHHSWCESGHFLMSHGFATEATKWISHRASCANNVILPDIFKLVGTSHWIVYEASQKCTILAIRRQLLSSAEDCPSMPGIPFLNSMFDVKDCSDVDMTSSRSSSNRQRGTGLQKSLHTSEYCSVGRMSDFRPIFSRKKASAWRTPIFVREMTWNLWPNSTNSNVGDERYVWIWI